MLPFDLHVLGLPPAFTLSQDQTLHLSIATRPEGFVNCLSAVSSSKLQNHSHAFLHFELTLLLLLRTSASGRLATRQTPAQVTCAHCQRSSGEASAPVPFGLHRSA